MIPSFTKVHNRFKFNNYHFDHNSLKEVAYSFVKEGEPYQKQVGNFLLDWFDDNDYVFVNTSGSTGEPKQIKLLKQAMVESAIATGDYFDLEPGNSALHCLPTEYIAGKMMLIRAIILGLELDLVEPSSNPLMYTNKTYNFCAMVPLQLQNSIEKLNSIETLIIGGASVSEALQKKLQDTACKVYATYGMTETITHIATKPLNHNNSKGLNYNTLPGVSISKDDRDCLMINAPRLSTEGIVTNDVVEIESESEFKILGRIDNVINSGGVKLFPEQIEAKLRNQMNNRFFIAGQDDINLGQELIMVVEGDTNTLENSIFKDLDTYETPKQIYNIERFIETASGKIQRKKILELLKN